MECFSTVSQKLTSNKFWWFERLQWLKYFGISYGIQRFYHRKNGPAGNPKQEPDFDLQRKRGIDSNSQKIKTLEKASIWAIQ